MLDKFFYGQARRSFGKFGSYAEYSLRLLSQVEPEHSVQSPFSWTRGLVLPVRLLAGREGRHKRPITEMLSSRQTNTSLSRSFMQQVVCERS